MEVVWGFIMEFERRPEWIHFFDKSFITDKKDGWVGTKYKDKLTFLGIPLFLESTITHYEENKMWCAKCPMPPFYPEIEVNTRDNGDGTIYSSLQFDITLKGPFRFIPKSLIKKQVDELIAPCIDRYIDILDRPEV